MFDGISEKASRTLAEAAGASPGVEFSNTVVKERPADAICAWAAKVGASLVVVGSRTRHGVDRVLLGSVAEHVVRHAPCSVLVVR
jgi:nucleotide-binding universal stress UspA family protein